MADEYKMSDERTEIVEWDRERIRKERDRLRSDLQADRDTSKRLREALEAVAESTLAPGHIIGIARAALAPCPTTGEHWCDKPDCPRTRDLGRHACHKCGIGRSGSAAPCPTWCGSDYGHGQPVLAWTTGHPESNLLFASEACRDAGRCLNPTR